MRRFNNLFIIPFTIIIVISLLSGFSGQNNQRSVEQLLKERTKILSLAYFKQIDCKKAELLLYEIETQPLLSSDIQNLRKGLDTEMDIIKRMDVVSIEQISHIYEYLSFRVRILWHLTGYEGSYAESLDYNLVIKISGGKTKISRFDAI